MQKCKYEVIVDYFKTNISSGEFKKGDPALSLTKAAEFFETAKETVVKAYKILRQEGILESLQSKGFFVAVDKLPTLPKIFVLLNDLNPSIEIFYNSFLAAIDGKAVVDVFFHHNNPILFDDFVTSAKGNYYSYIIKPFALPELKTIIKSLPLENVLIIDRDDYLPEGASFLVQDFYKDLYEKLESLDSVIERYDHFYFYFPEYETHPQVAKESFLQYFKQRDKKASPSVKANIITTLSQFPIDKNCCFLAVSDRGLIEILTLLKHKNLTPGKDVGILCYNDTPIKPFVENGISVITADFKKMGEDAALFALSHTTIRKYAEVVLVKRHSLC